MRQNLTEADLYRAAVKGMLSKIDPKLATYNQLLSARAYEELQIELRGQVPQISPPDEPLLPRGGS